MNAPDPIHRLEVPPHSVEAEQSVLGSLLLENRSLDQASDILIDSDFYRHEHRLIFGAASGLVQAGKPADVVTVFERLQSRGQADDAGGLEYINALAQSVPSAANMRRYAEIVADRSRQRDVIAAADRAMEIARREGAAADKLDAIAGLFARLERGGQRRMPKLLREMLGPRLDRIDAMADGKQPPDGAPTGIPRLDRMLAGGLRPGMVYLLAARPSVGKSSLAQSIGLHVAGTGRPVLMLSQEMPEGEIADRSLCGLGRVSYDGIQTGRLQPDDWGRLADAVERGQELPFWVDDQPALRLQDICAKARSIKGLQLLVVDYIQLCASDERRDNRNAEIEQISRGLKALAKDLGISIVLLSQLNREVEKRAGKEPQLSDLRDSGSLEQDADIVAFLWPVREFDGGRRLVGLQVAKNRQGRTGRFGLDFDGEHQRWAESTESVERVPSRGGDL